jgi:dipeptidyl aminopeptidase/acylaminoacyl peptidase
MFALALTLALAAAPAAQATHVSVAAPTAVVELDMGKLKGEPWRLAWSPDAREMYVQTVERDGHGAIKSTKHYLIALDSKSVKSADQEPAWASKYWLWKSGQVSPGAPAFKIRVEQRQESVRSTATPTGGDLARGGTADPTAGSSLSDVAAAANQTQLLGIYALKLGDVTIGEWVNEPVVTGVNFGWAPAPERLLVFTKRDGSGPLTLVDDQGHKQEVPGTKGATFPAFSADGAQLAWLARKDKKHFDLTIGTVENR